MPSGVKASENTPTITIPPPEQQILVGECCVGGCLRAGCLQSLPQSKRGVCVCKTRPCLGSQHVLPLASPSPFWRRHLRQRLDARAFREQMRARSPLPCRSGIGGPPPHPTPLLRDPGPEVGSQKAGEWAETLGLIGCASLPEPANWGPERAGGGRDIGCSGGAVCVCVGGARRGGDWRLARSPSSQDGLRSLRLPGGKKPPPLPLLLLLPALSLRGALGSCRFPKPPKAPACCSGPKGHWGLRARLCGRPALACFLKGTKGHSASPPFLPAAAAREGLLN